MRRYYAHADSVSPESKQFDFFVEVYLASDVDAHEAQSVAVIKAQREKIEELKAALAHVSEKCKKALSL